MKTLKVAAGLSCLALLTACEDKQVTEVDNTPLVKAVEISVIDFSDKLYFPAVANAAEKARLSFRVAGEINKLDVKEGERVKAGDIIAELDPTDYQLDVDNAQARYTVINSQYRRSSPLVKKGLLAKSQFDEIAAQRQIAYSELELAKLRLSFTKLRAPVDGIISRVSVDQYENIQVGQQVVNIHSVEDVEVVIQLPDQIYVNQPSEQLLSNVEALVRVPSGNEYTASIKEFTTEPDPSTGTFTVTLALPMPKDDLILDGMAVDVTSNGRDIGLDLKAGVLIPIEAVFNADGDELTRQNSYVWVLNDDKTVSKQQVVLGKANQKTLQIMKGLEMGQHVVVAGVSRLRDGMTVEVLSQETNNE
ncbi:MAG: efflux RND transporter periplasmic adaptor subunit [Vibrio toranzoniae]|jgi:RND family efflux transporter MFP subunit|uniref:efflux RND transporter periplasmic adaptor subunit n=1 Tax=Vibrio toranzoniae TaxID=1194427 RepID=UPI001378D2C7|nr:efflux RND transporter periplasmic adaptor subunit [Vibrio toranzoniae]NAZ53197.1 efflux RND transporter periplasmic adaptor subunit [Vibrio toranzoniae]NAZ68913.1 efflux RND transporter periplasmic adaptor subunit [Vibrio toranzoniae]NAZ91936.1 efflux RND transporter periplasmic adaptor subunit [Vibrio toranzoniae]NAZ97059.1 efflux RND transporter periplasmic adaptor subunit [Vibrio toranzoniae]